MQSIFLITNNLNLTTSLEIIILLDPLVQPTDHYKVSDDMSQYSLSLHLIIR